MRTLSRTVSVRKSYRVPFESNEWGAAYFDGLTGHINIAGSNNYNVSGYTIIITFIPKATSVRNRPYAWNNLSTIFYGGTAERDLHWFAGNGTSFGAGSFVANFMQYETVNSLAITSDGTTGILYKNGIKKDTQVAVPIINLNVSTLTISGGNTFDHLLGQIYEYITIAQVLTQSQISNLYYGRILPTQFDCKIWQDYRLGHARDLSNNGNNGTLAGNVRFV